MILGGMLNAASIVVNGATGKKKYKKTIRGSVVLVKKNVLDFNAVHSTVADSVFELVGRGGTLQLVSADNAESANENGGKLGKLEALENMNLTFVELEKYDEFGRVEFLA